MNETSDGLGLMTKQEWLDENGSGRKVLVRYGLGNRWVKIIAVYPGEIYAEWGVSRIRESFFISDILYM